ncbi:MAG: hypothetical protein DCE90_14040 [Pseudanabaena sp.]|nr:MAG: hypothetical protein DCE90_14040 [Pseudanabaena sp.]
MSNQLPDFLTGTWLQRYHVGFEGDRVGSFGVAPIRPVLIPFLFTQPYVRLSVDSIQKKTNWTFGARVYQTITTQLGFEDVISEHTLDLGKPEIINMLLFPDGYRLKLSFPTWLVDVDIVIHEYIEAN